MVGVYIAPPGYEQLLWSLAAEDVDRLFGALFQAGQISAVAAVLCSVRDEGEAAEKSNAAELIPLGDDCLRPARRAVVVALGSLSVPGDTCRISELALMREGYRCEAVLRGDGSGGRGDGGGDGGGSATFRE